MCFDMKFLPDVPYCLYWVVAEIKPSISSHKICNKFFIDHCQRWKEGPCMCETVFFFFVTEFSSVLAEICRVWSRILLGFLHRISTRNYFGKKFQKFFALQGYPLSRFLKCVLVFAILFWVHITLINSVKSYTSIFICCFLCSKEACPKKKHKKQI